MKKDLTIFEGHGIRRIYDEKTETWWFSVVDIKAPIRHGKHCALPIPFQEIPAVESPA